MKKEAEGDATRLGHELRPWGSNHNGTYYAMCRHCNKQVKVSPRLMGVARIRGEVVNLTCQPPERGWAFGW